MNNKPHDGLPAETGSALDRAVLESTPDVEQEPDLRGTTFLTIVLMMLIFGFWIMMYMMLLDL